MLAAVFVLFVLLPFLGTVASSLQYFDGYHPKTTKMSLFHSLLRTQSSSISSTKISFLRGISLATPQSVSTTGSNGQVRDISLEQTELRPFIKEEDEEDLAESDGEKGAFIPGKDEDNPEHENIPDYEYIEQKDTKREDEDSTIDSESNPPTLRFLLIGDWGKGGNTGKYYSSVPGGADDDTISSVSSSSINDSMALQADNNNKNNNKDNNKNNGNNKMLYQPQVARSMANLAANSSLSPSFIVALGDNFYVNGVSSPTDILWQYLWTDVYLNYPSLQIPWYAVLGNHDYGGGDTYSEAQVQRSRLNIDNGLWNMPAKNYSHIFHIPGGTRHEKVAILFIDTTTLAPSMNKCCNEQGGVSQEVQKERIENQLFHINRMLQELILEKPTWLLVAGHYPVFSDSSSGNVTELVTYLLPLLQKYRVHAYLSGHDHLSEHLIYQNELHFFVAGAGSMTDKLSNKQSAARLQWAGQGYAAFAYVDATRETLTIHYVDIYDQEKYNFTLSNPYSNEVYDSYSDDVDDDLNDPKDNRPGPLSESERERLQQRIAQESKRATIAVAVAASTSFMLVSAGVFMFFYLFWWPRRQQKRQEQQEKQQTLFKDHDNAPINLIKVTKTVSGGDLTAQTAYSSHSISSSCSSSVSSNSIDDDSDDIQVVEHQDPTADCKTSAIPSIVDRNNGTVLILNSRPTGMMTSISTNQSATRIYLHNDSKPHHSHHTRSSSISSFSSSSSYSSAGFLSDSCSDPYSDLYSDSYSVSSTPSSESTPPNPPSRRKLRSTQQQPRDSTYSSSSLSSYLGSLLSFPSLFSKPSSADAQPKPLTKTQKSRHQSSSPISNNANLTCYPQSPTSSMPSLTYPTSANSTSIPPPLYLLRPQSYKKANNNNVVRFGLNNEMTNNSVAPAAAVPRHHHRALYTHIQQHDNDEDHGNTDGYGGAEQHNHDLQYENIYKLDRSSTVSSASPMGQNLHSITHVSPMHLSTTVPLPRPSHASAITPQAAVPYYLHRQQRPQPPTQQSLLSLSQVKEEELEGDNDDMTTSTISLYRIKSEEQEDDMSSSIVPISSPHSEDGHEDGGDNDGDDNHRVSAAHLANPPLHAPLVPISSNPLHRPVHSSEYPLTTASTVSAAMADVDPALVTRRRV